MVKCPKCGSKEVASILYGKPLFNEELKQKLERKEVILGGCCLEGSDPKYRCNACKKLFGKPAIVTYRGNEEEYRDIVQSIFFEDGGFWGGYASVQLKKWGDSYEVVVHRPFEEPSQAYRRKLRKSEWDRVVEKLYGELFIHEWKKKYVEPHVLDGEQWLLQLTLEGNRERNYYGSNAYPALWHDLLRVFRPFFIAAGVEIQTNE